MGRLDDKVAIITGGAQGIGQASAIRVASEGATVIVADQNSCEATLKKIEEAGGKAEGYITDTRVAEHWERMVDHTISKYGRLDHLGNIAGVVNLKSPDTVVECTEEGWDFVVDTDLKGVWLGMKYSIPRMIEAGGGTIVNISSMAAKKGMLNLASYSAAKGGVIGLTQQTAYEYAEQGIRCNAIAPGTIDTPILDDITPEQKQINANSHLIKRLGRPEEIAATLTFLLSEESSFITGQTIPVDGGWDINGRNY